MRLANWWNSENGVHTRLKWFTFFIYGQMALFLPYLPLNLQHRGFTPTEIGLLLTVGPLVAIGANPIWGYAVDKTQNIKLILIALMTGTLAASQILFNAGPFWAVFTAMIAFYFFHSAISPINTSQVFHAIEGTQLRFGSFRIWGSLGYSAIVLLSGPVMDAAGIGKLGWVFGASMLLALAFGFLLRQASPQSRKKAKPAITFRESMRALMNGRFALFLFSCMLILTPSSVNSLYLSLFLEQLGGSASSIAWSMFAAAVLEVPLFLLLDRLTKPTLRSLLPLLLFACGVFAVRWVLMGFAQTPLAIVFIQCLHCVSFGFFIYTAAQMVELLTEKTYRASGQTMYALVQGALTFVIAGSIGGILYEQIGPHMLYFLCAGLTAFGFAGMAALRVAVVGRDRRRAAYGRSDGTPLQH